MKGYIYTILCPDDYFYIGSTININNRISSHKYSHVLHIKNIGLDNCSIFVNEVEYSSKNELQKLEAEYIKEFIYNKKCLNKNVPKVK
jgi:predicted GIY-YIG superfamily endonuclease